MLCCLGLFAGIAIGSTLGGPWALLAPVAGFGIGIVGDMKLMRSLHKKSKDSVEGCHGSEDTPNEEKTGSASNPIPDVEAYEKNETAAILSAEKRCSHDLGNNTLATVASNINRR